MSQFDQTHLIRNCKFKFKCDVTWESMTPVKETDPKRVRHCSKCNKRVYLTKTQTEIVVRIEVNDCIAIPVETSVLNQSFNSHLVGVAAEMPRNIKKKLEKK
jgi:hypothetical protein